MLLFYIFSDNICQASTMSVDSWDKAVEAEWANNIEGYQEAVQIVVLNAATLILLTESQPPPCSQDISSHCQNELQHGANQKRSYGRRQTVRVQTITRQYIQVKICDYRHGKIKDRNVKRCRK